MTGYRIDNQAREVKTMNFREARETLERGRNPNRRKIYNNTTLELLGSGLLNDHYIGLRLHDTVIIKYYPDYMILDSGGWRTVTTKARLNAYVPNVYIGQEKGIWYISGSLFYDGIKIDYKGNILSKIRLPDATIKENKRVKKLVRKYALDFVEAWRKDDFSLPSNEDCWYCLFKDEDGTIFGDFNDVDIHIQHHIEGSYFVPSLLLNALTEAGYSNPGFIYQYKSLGDSKNNSIYRAIYRYILKRLLPDNQV